jgi:hypothetical protein
VRVLQEECMYPIGATDTQESVVATKGYSERAQSGGEAAARERSSKLGYAGPAQNHNNS